MLFIGVLIFPAIFQFQPRSSPDFQRVKVISTIDFSEFGHLTINHIKS